MSISVSGGSVCVCGFNLSVLAVALPSAAPLRDQRFNKLLDCLAITFSLLFKLFPGRKIMGQRLNED